jgi:nicotinate-nucleotide pyrophosphorylase (carboxylating)
VTVTESQTDSSSFETKLWHHIDRVISDGLAEDLDELGDVTTKATIPSDLATTGRFLAKATGIVAGLHVVERVFAKVDSKLQVEWTIDDGTHVTTGTYFGTVSGPTASILVAERLALNLLQRMSGIATATRAMVDQATGTKARILDTRKTVPGLRYIDKLAVLIGGGMNHRHGLFDMVMIKDNHVSAAGGIVPAIDAVHSHLVSIGKSKAAAAVGGPDATMNAIKVEIETRTMDEVKQALTCIDKIDRIMLDNMTHVDSNGNLNTTMLCDAVALIDGRVDTEASGNVTLDTVKAIAQSGVDYISSGALTHSVTALDISLKIATDTFQHNQSK